MVLSLSHGKKKAVAIAIASIVQTEPGQLTIVTAQNEDNNLGEVLEAFEDFVEISGHHITINAPEVEVSIKIKTPKAAKPAPDDETDDDEEPADQNGGNPADKSPGGENGGNAGPENNPS